MVDGFLLNLFGSSCATSITKLYDFTRRLLLPTLVDVLSCPYHHDLTLPSTRYPLARLLDS